MKAYAEGLNILHRANAAVDEGAPAPVLSAALYQRFVSRGEAMRFGFDGDVEKKP